MKIKIKIIPDEGGVEVYEVDSYADGIRLLIEKEPEDNEYILVTPQDRFRDAASVIYAKDDAEAVYEGAGGAGGDPAEMPESPKQGFFQKLFSK